jgi:endonuclease G
MKQCWRLLKNLFWWKPSGIKPFDHSLDRNWFFVCLLLLVTAWAKTDEVAPATTSRDNNLALGNPSGATASTSAPTNYLLVKDQYTLFYNRDQGKPNWVSWHLSTA